MRPVGQKRLMPDVMRPLDSMHSMPVIRGMSANAVAPTRTTHQYSSSVRKSLPLRFLRITTPKHHVIASEARQSRFRSGPDLGPWFQEIAVLRCQENVGQAPSPLGPENGYRLDSRGRLSYIPNRFSIANRRQRRSGARNDVVRYAGWHLIGQHLWQTTRNLDAGIC
jgi:hypothetical protein